MVYKQMNAHERDLLKGSSSQGRLCRSLNDLMSNMDRKGTEQESNGGTPHEAFPVSC